MSGNRPHEALAALRAVEELAASDPSEVRGVLVTLVSIDGALCERTGASAVLAGEEAAGGKALNLAAAPDGLRSAALAAMDERRPRLAEFPLGEDDVLFGLGGLGGVVEAWIEPVTGELREGLRETREALQQGEGVVVELVLSGADAGRRRTLPGGHEAAKDVYAAGEPELDEEAERGVVRRLLRLPYIPMGKALLIGSGDDVRRLADLLDRLGFAVTVADRRPGRLRGEGWDRDRFALVEGGWDKARAACRPDEDAYVLVAARGDDADLEALRGALASEAKWVGFAGSAARAAKLLAKLKADGVSPRPGAFSAPAGLDVGAQTAEEQALAIAAEILAVRSERKGGRPGRARAAGASPAHRKGGVKVPGLVLAAGRGRRFGGASKLLADVDGLPVLRHVVEAALATKLEPVIVVLGCGAEAGLRALEGLDDPRLRVVFNPSWSTGKASSFEVGLREVPADAPGMVALLGDMPRVPPWLVERVLTEFELSGSLTFPVWDGPEGPKKGHPTAYPRSLFGEIRELVGDDTALAAIRRHWKEAVKIHLPDASTQADIDTAQDLELVKVKPEPQGRLL